MTKLERLMEEKRLSSFELANSNGNSSRLISINRVLDGEADITSLNLNLLTSIANGLGVPLEELLDPFDLDGRSSEIVYLNRIVERAKKQNAEYTNTYPNGGFIKGFNINKQSYRNEGEYVKSKTDYEILDPTKSHDEQGLPKTYELNNEFLYRNENKRNTRNQTIRNLHSKYNKNSLAFLIYTPLSDGADLKVAVSVFDPRGNIMYSEIYGVEWIDKEDQKEVAYYKGRIEGKVITPDRVKNVKKEIVSELEFYRGLKSQFSKFKLGK